MTSMIHKLTAYFLLMRDNDLNVVSFYSVKDLLELKLNRHVRPWIADYIVVAPSNYSSYFRTALYLWPRKVLGDLINEYLVCSEDINERTRCIRDGRHDTTIHVTAAEGRGEKRPPWLKSKKRSVGDEDEDEEEGNSDDDNDEATKQTHGHGVKSAVYINPLCSMDVVEFCVYLMRRHLESSQNEVDPDNSYKCSNIFRCSCSLPGAQLLPSLLKSGSSIHGSIRDSDAYTCAACPHQFHAGANLGAPAERGEPRL